VFEQCGSACVYCGLDMGAAYESWLNLSIDHVIPAGDGRRLGYPPDWVEDIANLVTSCRACNEFLNAYRVIDSPPQTVDAFFDLRDLHFERKREWVLNRHATERAWYDSSRPEPAAIPAAEQ
jgi:HNH endonuclease